MIRSTLVEVAQVLVRGTVGKNEKKLKLKQMGENIKVIDYVDKVVLRLQKKYRQMIYRGVNRNIVIIVIAGGLHVLYGKWKPVISLEFFINKFKILRKECMKDC